MTNKEKLIRLVEIKNSIIHRVSKITYINEKDIKDIRSWPEDDCIKIYNNIIEYVSNPLNKLGHLNSNTCPWCIYYHFINNSRDRCNACGYGKRHGICDEPYSKYKELVYRNSFTPLNIVKYTEIISNIEDSEDSNDLQR